jgi:hypothetical protein
VTARIREVFLESPWGGYVTVWEVDPILAIGGDYHGEVLPVVHGEVLPVVHGEVLPVVHGPVIMVPERPDLTTWLADPPPEITMPGTLRYERKKVVTAGRADRARMVFPVYVLVGMPEQEAIIWVELVAAWSRLLVTVDRLGCLLSRIHGGIWRRRPPVHMEARP